MDKALKIYVRPDIEFAVQAWSPWYAKDIDLLEKVQMRAVNMVVGLVSTSYEGKLRELNLTSLSERRARGDMIQVWKYLHKQNPGGERLFKMSNEQHTRLSRHTFKPWNISRPHANLDVRRNFFTMRVVDKWNSLPHEVQDAEDLNQFKNPYDAFQRTTQSSF